MVTLMCVNAHTARLLRCRCGEGGEWGGVGWGGVVWNGVVTNAVNKILWGQSQDVGPLSILTRTILNYSKKTPTYSLCWASELGYLGLYLPDPLG